MPDSLIYESSKSRIYLQEDSENKPVILKVLNLEYPTPFEIDQFYNEYEIINSLNLKRSRNVLGKTKKNHRHAMFLEWFEGETLGEKLPDFPGDLSEKLKLAIAIAEALDEIHKHNIIHKDINPANILFNPKSGDVRLIDFGIASNYDLKQYHSENPERLEGTLAYNSPEETGRMNRKVDYRSDLYSLGVVLYELFCGRLPFDTTDALEMVHSHIAVIPESPIDANSGVPLQVSAIIEKLMAKKAEDRYQSASGLKSDLQRCLNDLLDYTDIGEFILAQEDFSPKFTLPQKLYGREREIDAIINAFDHCAMGDLATVFIAGYSGTGKSVLVHEVHKPITARKGYFIEGKFDQFQRSVPYYAIIEAFKELVDILLTENESRLSHIRDEIQEALGEEGLVLTNVIPNLEHIIGEQPEIPELRGTESQNRFNYIIRKFVKAISTKEHPIVLFIDDMQWADSASLGIFKLLMTDFENKYFLAIGAYRDNEVGEGHPFMMMVNEMLELGSNINTIQIGNLDEKDVSELVKDALGRDDSSCSDLAEVVYNKTGGNAFFVAQFLKSLHDDQILLFDTGKNQWTWDEKELRSTSIADNVVDLVASKIRKLDPETQETLTIAACIGSVFKLDTLAVVLELDPVKAEKSLSDGIKENFVIPYTGKKYKFSHDRIQQAVYSLIPDESRQEIHYKIGKHWIDHFDKDTRNEKLFDLVNQWNQAISLLTKDELDLLSNLNLGAGIKAKENSAFENAFEYLGTGISLLGDDCWDQYYDLSLSLHTEALEAAYLCSLFDEVDRLFEITVSKTSDVLERVKPFETRIHAYKAQNRLLEAIETGLEILAELGERFPKKPNMLHVFKDLSITAFMLRGKSEEDLLNRPEMLDEKKKAALRIGADIMPSVYWATPTLVPVLAFRMVQLSLKYGNSPVSAFAYGSYGVLMCGVLEFMKTGNKFGRLAIDLLNKLDAKEWKAQIYVTTYALILFWKEHIKNTLPPLKDSYHIGLETGAIEFACVNTNIYCIHSYLCGKPLVKLEEETRNYSQSYRQFKQMTNFYYNEVYRQAMLNFMGRSENPLTLTGEAYNEEERMKVNLENNDQTGTFFIHFNKVILGYHFGDHEMAYEHGVKARKLLEAVLAKFEIPNLLFYEALNHIRLWEDSGGTKGSLSRARKNRNKLKKWAKSAPENFEHRYLLINAELMRIKGRKGEARLVYDRAIAGATKTEYLNDEALALELAGLFYVGEESQDLAEYYLRASHNRYLEWGAEAKMRELEKKYPSFITTVSRAESEFSTTTTLTKTYQRDSSLDIATVLKASTSISGEVVLSKLISRLIEILVENAGAQRGALILEANGQWFVQGRYEGKHGETKVLQNIPVNPDDYPESVITYLIRTGEMVVINTPEEEKKFSGDNYIQSIEPKALLCLPIVKQGRVIGLIYLEHRDMPGIFNRSRIELLRLLSGQIAISLDNAILYRQLEQKVEERTAELAEEKKKSDDLLHNILPEETAEELKVMGKTRPRKFDNVTVLFSDFVDFTKTSESLTAEEIVTAIDTCFSAFDQLTSQFGVEKIKTIGDSYMCAAGLPVLSSDHAKSAFQMALAMKEYMDKFNKGRKREGLPELRIRIGLHSGPVVAGVVGTRKFAYDIWGDTVNTASRMESAGEPGRVNVSSATYQLLKDEFKFESRGKISAKGKGNIQMYFALDKSRNQ